MKIVVKQAVAAAILAQALKTCNTKAKGEVDAEFLIRDDGADVTINSFNDYAEQRLVLPIVSIDGELGQEGFTVTGSLLTAFIKQFPGGEVSLVFDPADRLVLVGSADRATKVAFPSGLADEFTQFNFLPDGRPITVDGASLAAALRQTAFSAATDATLAPLTGVYLTLNGDTVHAIASDQTRIAVYQLSGEEINDTAIRSFLLPRESAETMASLIEGESSVILQPGARHLRLSWGKSCYTTRLESTGGHPFPDLTSYLEGEDLATVVVSRADLLRSLKLAALVAGDSYVTLTASADGLDIGAEEQSTGAIQDRVPTQEGSSGAAEVTVGCKMLVKGLDTCTSAFVTLYFRHASIEDAESALVIVDKSFTYFLFPVIDNQPAKAADVNSEADNG